MLRFHAGIAINNHIKYKHTAGADCSINPFSVYTQGQYVLFLSFTHEAVIKQLTAICCTWLLVALMAPAVYASTTVPGELLLFPSLSASRLTSSPPATRQLELEPGLDIFYSYNENRLLALVEYFINSEEQEFERLQLGWRLSDTTSLWLGRFHTPLGYWSTNFHHGAYLQTSINRPILAEYEDFGGILPLHTSGAMLHHSRLHGGSKLSVYLAAGAGPDMQSGALTPADIFRPFAGNNRGLYALRAVYYPEAFADSQIGFFRSHADIRTDNPGVNSIIQTLTGLFAVYADSHARLTTSVVMLEHQVMLNTGASRNRSYAGYMQAEYTFGDRLTPYVRAENISNDESDAYLQQLPAYVQNRTTVGARYSLNSQHAITLEYSHSQSLADETKTLSLQWSAVLP